MQIYLHMVINEMEAKQ